MTLAKGLLLTLLLTSSASHRGRFFVQLAILAGLPSARIQLTRHARAGGHPGVLSTTVSQFPRFPLSRE